MPGEDSLASLTIVQGRVDDVRGLTGASLTVVRDRLARELGPPPLRHCFAC